MEASTPLNVRQLVFLLGAYLPRIGFADLASGIKVEEQGEGQCTVTLGNMGLGVDTGWEVTVPTVGGHRTVDGYRVFSVVTHSGGRWHPDEEEDKTEKECVAMGDAIEHIGMLLAQFAARDLPDLPAELAPQEPVLEEV